MPIFFQVLIYDLATTIFIPVWKLPMFDYGDARTILVCFLSSHSAIGLYSFCKRRGIDSLISK